MIIPIRCFTCGNPIADKYKKYQEKVREKKLSKNINIDKVVYLTNSNMEKTPEGEALDELELTRICCRRHFLSHVDIYTG